MAVVFLFQGYSMSPWKLIHVTETPGSTANAPGGRVPSQVSIVHQILLIVLMVSSLNKFFIGKKSKKG